MIKLSLLSKYTFLILLIGFGFYNICKSQNLIRNGSFENISPPASWGNWGGEFVTFSQTPSHRVLFDWDEFNSADLFTASCTHTWSGVSINIKGYCQAKDGGNYTGFMLFANGATNDGKEYIYQQLTTPLLAGKLYCLSFYVSKADRKEYAIKNIGAYFSNTVQSTGSIGYINKTPQVVNQSGIITDTVNWVQIQGCFTAIGGEQFITIGNFNSDANTDTLHPGTNNPIPSNPEYAYYYIDDISLIDQTTVGITELNNKNSIEVYPNPASNLLQVNVPREYTNCEIGIYNAIGELILNEQITSNHSTIDIENLQSGVYYYQILTNGKPIKNDKIIIIIIIK